MLERCCRLLFFLMTLMGIQNMCASSTYLVPTTDHSIITTNNGWILDGRRLDSNYFDIVVVDNGWISIVSNHLIGDQLPPTILGTLTPIHIIGCDTSALPPPVPVLDTLRSWGLQIYDDTTPDSLLTITSQDYIVFTDCNTLITRTYCIGDTCGNVAVSQQDIVIDMGEAIVSDAPHAMTLTCAADATLENIVIPVVVNGCGDTVISHQMDVDSSDFDGCAGDIVYLFHYQLCENNFYYWPFTYHIAPPTLTLPANRVEYLQCLQDAVAPSPPVVLDGCGDTIVPTMLPVLDNTNGCTGIRAYTWSYQDCDGSESRWVCTFIVSDTIAPTFILEPEIIVCSDLEGMFVITPELIGFPADIHDNCDELQGMIIFFTDNRVYTSGADTVFRTWTIKDHCDNSRTQMQRIVIHEAHEVTIIDSICAGEPYNAYGFQCTPLQDTVLHDTSSVVLTGCDSVTHLVLQVLQPSETLVYDTVNSVELPYYFNDISYSQSGTYTHHLTNSVGCDSAITLQLIVNYPSESVMYMTVCDSLEWAGTTFTQSGVYIRHFEGVNVYDSIVTLHLVVNHSVTELVEATACDSLVWHGTTYRQSGDYVRTLQSFNGCDSIVTLRLTVNHSVAELVETTACDSLVWHGTTYRQSGDYVRTLQSVNGCDSIVTLRLTVNHSVSELVEATACGSYTWNGVNYIKSGIYEQHFLTSSGCDSAVTLVLNVLDTTLSILSSDDFCDNQSVVLIAQSDLAYYLWNTGEQTSSITVLRPGYYMVTAYQENCETHAYFIVENCEYDYETILPNAITPSNNDGLNDCLSIPEQCKSIIGDFKISIYNRWGERVFYSTNKDFKWCGEYLGKTLPQDVYSYRMEFFEPGASPIRHQFKGSITIL